MANRSSKDENFRLQLLNDAKKVIELEFGVNIPELIQVSIIEENEYNVCFVIPLKV